MTARKLLLFAAFVLAAAARGPEAMAQPETVDRAKLHEALVANIARGVRAPEFGDGKAWLNVSRPLSLKDDLAGRVVLIDFWTYCCINCMHVLPDLDYLEQRFASKPFAVVGVHSAKFANEKDADNIRQAILRYGIRHPVVNDADFKIWSAYAANAWPTLVAVGPDGRILAVLSGEGHRELLEAIVDEALAIYGAKGQLKARPLPILLERDKVHPRELSFPGKLAIDGAHDRLYIADSNHDRIVVTTLAGAFVETIGSGERGLADGPSATARFNRPQGLALDGTLLFVADTESHALRQVDLVSHAVTTLAGDGTQSNDRTGGHGGKEQRLSSPWDVAVRGNDLFISMAGTHQLWRYDRKLRVAEAYAGSGSEARVDGPRREAALAQPSGLSVIDANELVFADSESSSIRLLDTRKGTIATLAGADSGSALFAFGDKDGTGFDAKLQHPLGVLAAGGTVYVADTYNHRLKRLDRRTGRVQTLAGTGKPGAQDGPFDRASFYEPSGLALNGNRLYVADADNHRIRVLDLAARTVSTLPLSNVPLPMTDASRSVSGDVPLLPHAIRSTLAPLAVHAGKVDAVVRLTLPPERHLTDGAPSAWQVVTAGKVRAAGSATGKLERTTLTIPLDVEGDGTVELRALVYHCKSDLDCRIASFGVTVPLRAGSNGARSIDVPLAP